MEGTETVAEVGVNSTSFFDQIALFIQQGGVFMYVIMAVWAFGLVIAFTRFRKLSYELDVDGPSFMNELQRYILSNDVQGAIRVCSGSLAALPRVLKSGLKRASQSAEQIQNAIDATALEVIPKVEKSLVYLSLVANISTLLGLLGTIFGLIQSFAAVSAADPTQKSEILAKGISQAMNTTAAGLIAAISIMVLHAFLTNKSEKIINEIDEFSVKLLDLIGTKKESN
jgi:biopolymer transport protein ExbB/TolQ